MFPAIRKIIVAAAFLSFCGPVWARSWEYYANYKIKAPLNKGKSLYLNFEEETRYKNGINYYRKPSLGVSKKITSNLSLGFYYGYESKRGGWEKQYLFWPQADYKLHFGKFNLSSATKFERHCTKDTYRLREKIKLILPFGKKLSFWLGNESRVFSFFDCPYFGENEIFAGINCGFLKCFNLAVYYDLRRVKKDGDWQDTNCLRMDLTYKF